MPNEVCKLGDISWVLVMNTSAYITVLGHRIFMTMREG
jgi:hypothetical protein